MKSSVCVAIALGLLLPQGANAQAVKRDILGVSLGMPLPEITKPGTLASADEFQPMQEHRVQVGDRTQEAARPFGRSKSLACASFGQPPSACS